MIDKGYFNRFIDAVIAAGKSIDEGRKVTSEPRITFEPLKGALHSPLCVKTNTARPEFREELLNEPPEDWLLFVVQWVQQLEGVQQTVDPIAMRALYEVIGEKQREIDAFVLERVIAESEEDAQIEEERQTVALLNLQPIGIELQERRIRLCNELAVLFLNLIGVVVARPKRSGEPFPIINDRNEPNYSNQVKTLFATAFQNSRMSWGEFSEDDDWRAIDYPNRMRYRDLIVAMEKGSSETQKAELLFDALSSLVEDATEISHGGKLIDRGDPIPLVELDYLENFIGFLHVIFRTIETAKVEPQRWCRVLSFESTLTELTREFESLLTDIVCEFAGPVMIKLGRWTVEEG